MMAILASILELWTSSFRSHQFARYFVGRTCPASLLRSWNWCAEVGASPKLMAVRAVPKLQHLMILGVCEIRLAGYLAPFFCMFFFMPFLKRIRSFVLELQRGSGFKGISACRILWFRQLIFWFSTAQCSSSLSSSATELRSGSTSSTYTVRHWVNWKMTSGTVRKDDPRNPSSVCNSRCVLSNKG